MMSAMRIVIPALLLCIASCGAPQAGPELQTMPRSLMDDLGVHTYGGVGAGDLDPVPVLPLSLGLVDVFERPDRPIGVVQMSSTNFTFEVPAPEPLKSPDYGLYANPIK